MASLKCVKNHVLVTWQYVHVGLDFDSNIQHYGVYKHTTCTYTYIDTFVNS